MCKPCTPCLLHCVMPREELVDRQAVAAANLLDCDHAAEHRFDDRSLASHGPALRVGRRQLVGRGSGHGKTFVSVVRHLHANLAFGCEMVDPSS
jgi:hypothetical protein